MMKKEVIGVKVLLQSVGALGQAGLQPRRDGHGRRAPGDGRVFSAPLPSQPAVPPPLVLQ